MAINSVTNSATNLITSAQQKAATAAQTIASLPVEKNEVGGTKNVSPGDPLKPILALKEAAQENAAGVKVLETEKKMLGSIIDMKV